MSVSVQGTAQTRRIGTVQTPAATKSERFDVEDHHRRRPKLNYLLQDPPPRTSSKGTPSPSQPQQYPRASPRVPEDEPSDEEGEVEDGAEDDDVKRPAKTARKPAAASQHPVSGAHDSDDESEIVRDPFFQRYHILRGRKDDEDSDGSSTSHAETVGPKSPTSPKGFRQDSITDPLYSPGPSSPRTFPSQSPAAAAGIAPRHDSTAMQEITIAVVGARGVGKSTFIQNAFGLSVKPEEASVQRSMVLERIVYNCRLIEVQLDDLEIEDDSQKIGWPESIGESMLPRIDGLFLLYDANISASMECTGLLRVSTLPCVLVANDKSNSEFETKAKDIVPDLAVMRTARNTPSTQQQCATVLLRSIISKQNQAKFAAARRRANTSAVMGTLDRMPHARANSEYSLSGPRLSGSTLYASSASHHSFVNADELRHRQASLAESDFDFIPSVIDEHAPPDIPSAEIGYTFNQLVDKLIAQPLSKTDSKFVAIFLALYRVFAAPLQLLDAILARFEKFRASKQPQLITTRHQQRLLSVLDLWVSTYPGDFANKATRQRLSGFATSLLSVSIFSIAAKEISGHLEITARDDDADWGLSDDSTKPGRVLSDTSSLFEESELERQKSKGLGGSTDPNDAQSPTLAKSRSPGSSIGTINYTPSHTLIHIIESAATQARNFIPHPRIPLSKTHWRSLMDTPDESIAKELTHMDWIMFSSIRPRDLVRHVSVPTARKMQTKSLENVNRAIEHFNHLAYWVANFILFRDKPKHRAMMMEKFMRIARKLRELNNYNSLGAILAGLQSTPIHRLLQTRDLVTTSIQKDYLKLEILMSTAKSHFAYRLAWENSSIERIPYIPLHLRDLMSASQGNRTFLTDAADSDGPPRINWKKFEIMGEVVVGIQKAQEIPYPKLERSEEVKSLLLECKLTKDDDELYDRSTALEAAFGANDRRRFNWFQRSASTQP